MTDTVEVPEEAMQAAKRAFARHEAEWRAVWHSAIEDAVTAAAVLLRAQWDRELRTQIAAKINGQRGDVDPNERDLYKRGVAYGLAAAANVARGDTP